MSIILIILKRVRCYKKNTKYLIMQNLEEMFLQE